MRILSISGQKPDSTGSGVFLSQLVKGFHKAGMEQTVVAAVYPKDQVELASGVRFYPVCLPFPIPGMSDEMPYESTVFSQMTEEQLQIYKDTFYEKIHEVIETFHPDLILCHHLYLLTSLVRSWFPELNVYGVCHGSDLRQIEKNPLKREFIQTQIPKLNQILVLHGAQKEQVSRIFGVESSKIKVIGTGYDASIFHQCDIEEDEKIHREPPMSLIFAGKISEKKGIKSLLRCVNHLDYPKEMLQIKLAGGSGNQREYEEISALAKECKYPVLFLGKLDQNQLALEFSSSDVFVLPSFYEGLPLVLLEAMACGLKTICTDLPGIQGWMDENVNMHQVRFVAPPEMIHVDEPKKDALPAFEERLAGAIKEALEDVDYRSVDVNHLSWDSICNKIIHA